MPLSKSSPAGRRSGTLRPLLAALLLSAATACGREPATDPLATPVDRVSILPATVSLVEGSSLMLRAVAFDAAGDPIDRLTVPVWSSTNATTATVSAVGRLRGVTTGAAVVTATIEGKTGQALVTVVPVPVGAVVVTPTTAALETGDTLTFVAAVKDSAGGLLVSKRVQWSSSNSAIAQVDQDGRVTAMGAGLATITALSEGQRGSATVTVTWAPVDTVLVTPTPGSLGAGDTLTLSAIALDAGGNRLALPIVWSSSAPAVATVGRTGLVTAIAPGTVTITATTAHGGVAKQGHVALTITAGTRPRILSIMPTPLRPGAEATIAGVNFGSRVEDHVVTIGGQPAPVLDATPTTLTVRVPVLGGGGCSGTTTPGSSATVTVDVQQPAGTMRASTVAAVATSGSSLALAVGESIFLPTLSHADSNCAVLPAVGGTYLVSIVNGSTSPSATMTFDLSGALLGSAVQAGATTSPALSLAPTARRAPRPAAQLARARQHDELLTASHALARRYAPARRSAPLRAAALQAAPTAGEQVSLRMPQSLGALCTPHTVTARVVYAGPKAVVFEDIANPMAGSFDAAYQALGQEFESVSLPLLESHFGNPFAYDAQLSGIGRIYMLFSKRVNDIGGEGLMGFVYTGDFMSPTECAASNRTQMFYARVPTTPDEVGTWRSRIRSTTIHEVKHLTSYAERFARSAPLEESWLEESTAMVSEELFARTQYPYVFQGDAGFTAGLQCELALLRRSASGACADKPIVMFDHVAFLADYLADPKTLTPIGKANGQDYTFYGSGWSLVRWMLDHHTESERTVLRALTTDASRTGVANLMAHAGQPTFATLLGGYALSVGADNWPGVNLGTRGFLSWNLRDIYGRLHQEVPGAFPAAYPLAPRTVPNGAFTLANQSMRGGSHQSYLVTAPADAALRLRVQGPGGALLPATAAMAVLRIN